MSRIDPESLPRKRWLVVGGGILGLTLAKMLAERGQEVVVAEAKPDFGGLASAWKIGEIVWDRYYHVTLLSDTKLRGLLNELGLEEEVRWVTTRTGFFSGGKLYSLSNSWEFLRFPPLTLIEKLRLGATIYCASKIKDWRALEKIPVAHWLKRWSGDSTFTKIWLPLLRAKLGDAYSKTSAAFIWAYISRMYRARRSGMKTEMFGYVPGGYARVLEALTNRLRDLGVDLLPNTAVEQIHTEDNGSCRVASSDGREWLFDNVISTLPSPLISHSCKQLSEREHSQLHAIDYIGVVCVSLVLKHPLAPYYVTNITDTWVPMTAIVEMSNIVGSEQLSGRTLVYLPKYLPSSDDGLSESDEQIVERFCGALARMYPHFTSESVVASRVARAKYVMAVPTIEYSEKLAPVVTSVPGFYALNSAHITEGTLNVNETIELAERKLLTEVWPDFLRRYAAQRSHTS